MVSHCPLKAIEPLLVNLRPNSLTGRVSHQRSQVDGALPTLTAPPGSFEILKGVGTEVHGSARRRVFFSSS